VIPAHSPGTRTTIRCPYPVRFGVILPPYPDLTLLIPATTPQRSLLTSDLRSRTPPEPVPDFRRTKFAPPQFTQRSRDMRPVNIPAFAEEPPTRCNPGAFFVSSPVSPLCGRFLAPIILVLQERNLVADASPSVYVLPLMPSYQTRRLRSRRYLHLSSVQCLCLNSPKEIRPSEPTTYATTAHLKLWNTTPFRLLLPPP